MQHAKDSPTDSNTGSAFSGANWREENSAWAQRWIHETPSRASSGRRYAHPASVFPPSTSSDRQVSVFTVDIGPSDVVQIFPGFRMPTCVATPTTPPSVEKISCTCGAQIRHPLPGYNETEANGVELTRGEKEYRERNGGRGIPESDITNCTGRSKQRATHAEWLLQQRRAVLAGLKVSEVSQPVLPQDTLYVLHCDDLNMMAEDRKAKEEAKYRAVTEQDTILEDTQGMRAHLNTGGERDARQQTSPDNNVEPFLSATGEMRSGFHGGGDNQW